LGEVEFLTSGALLRPQAQLAALARCPVFVAAVVAISGLYFVVTAVQYWASQFFTADFHRPIGEVTKIFLIVAGTAPVLGVVFGSTMVDRLGGYETAQQMAKSLALTTIWGVIAATSGIVAAFIEPFPDAPGATWRFYIVAGCIWLLLFFGGAVLPAVTGISMAAVPEGLRKSASSWSMLLYNVFGFSLGAYLPGIVAEHGTLRSAMQVVLLWATLPCVAMACAYVLASRSAANGTEAQKVRLGISKWQTKKSQCRPRSREDEPLMPVAREIAMAKDNAGADTAVELATSLRRTTITVSGTGST